MRTELSNLSNSSRKSAARDNVAAFSALNERRKAKLALFKEGDLVLARQGKGGKFCLPGTICKPAGKGAWLIDTASGQRVYNQSHLLPASINNHGDSLDEADEAYEEVQPMQNPLEGPSNEAQAPPDQRLLRPRHKLKKPEKYMFMYQ